MADRQLLRSVELLRSRWESSTRESRLRGLADIHSAKKLGIYGLASNVGIMMHGPTDKRRIQFVDHPVKACRRCNIAIPDEEANRLRSTGLCEARCHGFILTRTLTLSSVSFWRMKPGLLLKL